MKKEKELEQRIETLEKMVMLMHLHVKTSNEAMTEFMTAFNKFIKKINDETDKPKQTPTDPLTKTLFKD